MKPTTAAALCLAAAVCSYLAWTAAVADDYDHGFKHVAAVATAVLVWVFVAGFIAAVTRTVWHHLRARRSDRRSF